MSAESAFQYDTDRLFWLICYAASSRLSHPVDFSVPLCEFAAITIHRLCTKNVWNEQKWQLSAIMHRDRKMEMAYEWVDSVGKVGLRRPSCAIDTDTHTHIDADAGTHAYTRSLCYVRHITASLFISICREPSPSHSTSSEMRRSNHAREERNTDKKTHPFYVFMYVL